MVNAGKYSIHEFDWDRIVDDCGVGWVGPVKGAEAFVDLCMHGGCLQMCTPENYHVIFRGHVSFTGSIIDGYF